MESVYSNTIRTSSTKGTFLQFFTNNTPRSWCLDGLSFKILITTGSPKRENLPQVCLRAENANIPFGTGFSFHVFLFFCCFKNNSIPQTFLFTELGSQTWWRFPNIPHLWTWIVIFFWWWFAVWSWVSPDIGKKIIWEMSMWHFQVMEKSRVILGTFQRSCSAPPPTVGGDDPIWLPFLGTNIPPHNTFWKWFNFSKGGRISRWWFQTFFIFTLTWGNDPIWRAYFSNGLVNNHQPDMLVPCKVVFSDVSKGVKQPSPWFVPRYRRWSLIGISKISPFVPRKFECVVFFFYVFFWMFFHVKL